MTEDDIRSDGKHFLGSSRWFFRAYIALSVCVFFGLMIFPSTSWIFYDFASVYVIGAVGTLVWAGFTGLDLVAERHEPKAAVWFAALHCLLCIAIWFATVWVVSGILMFGTAAERVAISMACIALLVALGFTARRAIVIARECVAMQAR